MAQGYAIRWPSNRLWTVGPGYAVGGPRIYAMLGPRKTLRPVGKGYAIDGPRMCYVCVVPVTYCRARGQGYAVGQIKHS